MIHSIVPEEMLWEGADQIQDDTIEMSYGGIRMQVQPLNGYEAKIVRLFSPFAGDYLNPAWAPGEVIRFVPKL